LNRFSTPTSGSGASAKSSGSSSSSASASGTSGGGGGGGGGFGGRGGDFDLILQTLAPAGGRVKKGDVIAEFDRQNMLLRLDDFRSVASQIEASLKTLRTTLDVEKKAHERSIELARAAVEKARQDLKTIPVQGEIDAEKLRLSEQEKAANYKLLQAERRWKEASQLAEWRVAELERDQFNVELKRAELNADRMLVKAPMDGITVMSTITRGGEMAQIRAGDMMRPGMPFMKIVEPNSMIVSAAVNQVDIESFRVGAKATVRFDAYPDLQLPAHVYSVGAMPKTGGFRATYVKEVPVVLRLDKMDPRVIPDLSVSADVVVSEEPAAVQARREAIFADGGQPCVFVWGGVRWERRPVELGPANNIAAVIRSGLRAGDVIAAERPRVTANK
jgi:multidrug efflux pump subunit AcrA (membrane-fusion protein)